MLTLSCLHSLRECTARNIGQLHALLPLKLPVIMQAKDSQLQAMGNSLVSISCSQKLSVHVYFKNCDLTAA